MTAIRVSEPLPFINDDQLERHLDHIRMTWKVYKFETTQLAIIDTRRRVVTVYQKVRKDDAA